MQDVEIWKWLIEHLWVPFVAAVGWVVKMTLGRLDRIEAELAGKADKSDMDAMRQNVIKLFENAERDRALTRDLHEKALEKIDSKTQQILDAIRQR